MWRERALVESPVSELGVCAEKKRWIGPICREKATAESKIACMCGGRCPDPSGYVARCVVDSAIVAVAIISCSNLLCGTRKGEGTDG